MLQFNVIFRLHLKKLNYFWRDKMSLNMELTSVLRQVRSLLQSEYSEKFDLVLRLIISSILSFPQGHTVAAYVFFLLFPPLLSFRL